ncbi:MAG: porin [Magnetospiraceae bacterium]
MKKILLGTTGLIAAAMVMSSPASAAEKIRLGLGGYMEQWVGFADQDTLYSAWNEFDQQSDSEIYFTGSTVLDNAITVGVTVQLEAERNAGARWIDDSFLYLSSETLGTLQLGSVPAATDSAHNSAPDVGISRGDSDDWVARASFVTDTTAVESDAHKIQYVSPNFSGFQVGGMYIPDFTDSGNSMPMNTTPSMTSSLAGAIVLYNGDFDGVTVGFDAAYATTENNTDGFQVGLSVGFNGFTIGGSYFNVDDDDALYGRAGEHTNYDLGVSYASGPYALSLSWFHGELDANMGGDDELEVIMGSASYAMGPGIDLKGSIFHQSSESGGGDDGDGWGAVGGVTLSF